MSIDQFDKERIRQLFAEAARMAHALQKRQRLNLLTGKILAPLFFEASTRTHLSFASAMYRLGGQVLNFSPNETRAGGNWGESLSDTARMINGYADAVVVRHSQVNALREYVAVSDIPVINGGSGEAEQGAEHPTQALLDLYMIQQELGGIENRKVLLIGDMKLRVVRSLLKALSRFPGGEVYLLAPDPHWLSPEDEEEYHHSQLSCQRIHALEEVLGEVDVIYQNGIAETRIVAPKAICLTKQKLCGIKPEAIILHSLPRTEDLATDVDSLPQARYFVQAQNAVPVRMALLAQLFGSATPLVYQDA